MTHILAGYVPNFAFLRVTRQALLIVGAVVRYEIAMRIMTGNAADTRVSTVEALAIGQAIWLETYIDLASPIASHHRLPCSVTLAAEIGQVLGREFFQVRRRGPVGLSLQGSQQMSTRTRMAMFAGDARLKRLQMQLPE